MTPPIRLDNCHVKNDAKPWICAIYQHLSSIGASAGRCVAQRIDIPMIAGGNHTLIQYDPALQHSNFQTTIYRSLALQERKKYTAEAVYFFNIQHTL